MLLFDMILQGKVQDTIKESLGVGYPHLQQHVRGAHKFVLDRSMAAAADAVTTEEVEKIIHSCRVPFKDVWIEVLQQDRPKFFHAALRGARASMGVTEDLTMIKQPKRIGLLIRCAGESRERFTATMAWSFTGDEFGEHIELSLLTIAIDLTREGGWFDQLKKKLVPFGTSNLEQRILTLPSTYHVNLLELLATVPPEFVTRLWKEAAADWAHEPQFWLAVLALLNCRNVAAAESVDISGLNRVRAKQGRPLFAEHKILKLRLPGHQRQRINGHGSSNEMRGHFVRGHFKERRTGIFYWSDFYRGDPTRPLDKTYEASLEDK